MRKISYKPYVCLALLLLLMLSMPYQTVNSIRSAAVATIAPPWRMFHFLKESFFKIGAILPTRISPEVSQELDQLRLQNQHLQAQLETVRAHLTSEEVIREKLSLLETADPTSKFFHKKIGELFRFIDLQAHSVLGKVIFREPASWSSSFWINVGEQINGALGKQVIAKNSPVVVGPNLIGVVEYVGQKRSRVRLITDSGLVPSVRVLRGAEQNRVLFEQIESLQAALQLRGDIPQAAETVQMLHRLKEGFKEDEATLYLAKGELYGSSEPLWRSRGLLLHGVGFNYDFADEEGPARHLQTGEPLHALGKGKGTSLVKTGDLLITTGMDGVFPPGFRVAQVVHVHPLREGAPSFDLEAKSLVKNLDTLSYVTILPPVES